MIEREKNKQIEKAKKKTQKPFSTRFLIEKAREKKGLYLFALKYDTKPTMEAALCVYACVRAFMFIYNSATLSFIIPSTAISFPCTRSQPWSPLTEGHRGCLPASRPLIAVVEAHMHSESSLHASTQTQLKQCSHSIREKKKESSYAVQCVKGDIQGEKYTWLHCHVFFSFNAAFMSGFGIVALFIGKWLT